MRVTSFQARAFLFLAAAMTVATYWPGLSGPFVFDDYSNVVEIHLRTLDWAELGNVAFSNASGPLRRPLANASFALNHYFFGPGPFSYKVVNLVIHLLCGLLVYVLARCTLIALRFESATARSAALLTAAGWLLHPLQVSTVLYTVQRMAQLSAFFTLAALWAYVAGRTRLGAGNRHGWWFIGFCFLVLSPLGLASKENAALIPVFILGFELFVFRFAAPETRTRRDLLVIWSLGIALPLLLGVLYALTHFAQFQANYELRSFTMLERLLTESRVLWFYLCLIFVPLPAHMGFYHDDFTISRSLDPSTIAALAGIGMLVAAMFALRRRAPVISFGIAWFLVAHAMEGSFLGLELVFEHRNYLALFGPALVMGLGGVRLTQVLFSAHSLRAIALVAPLILLAALTWSQVQRWSGVHEFLASNAINQPLSARANSELAWYYAQIGEWDKSQEYFDRHESLIPDDPGTSISRLRLWCARESIDDESIDTAVTAMGAATQVGNLAQNLTMLADRWRNTGRCPALSAGQLLRLLDAALLRPEFQAIPELAGNLHAFRGTAYRRLGEHQAAIDAFSSALELKPGDVDLLLLRAYIQLSLRQYDGVDRYILELREADASSLRHSGRRIDGLETSLLTARGLEQRLPQLTASCAEGRWSSENSEQAKSLLASSDTIWVVLPLLEELMSTVVTTCPSSAGENALALLDAIEENPNLDDFLPGQILLQMFRARLLKFMGRQQDALEAYRQAAELDPTGFEAAYELAYLQLNMDRLDEARATTERMRALESAAEPGNDARLAELDGYIDSASR
jgi:tetratricopeptide (TPR) repeat protein